MKVPTPTQYDLADNRTVVTGDAPEILGGGGFGMSMYEDVLVERTYLDSAAIERIYRPVQPIEPFLQKFDSGITLDGGGMMLAMAGAAGSTGGASSSGYEYDYENRLVRIIYSDYTSTEFVYDALGRRLKTIEKDAGGAVTEETRYVYDGLDLIAELDGLDSNAVIASYTHGPGIDDPLIMRYDGYDYFYHKDHLGSITAMTDISQNIVKEYTYDAFGNILSEPSHVGDPGHNAFTYTAREYHSRSGLYYYRARFYDPAVGRFITQDPIGYLGGINLYAYVGNDPIDWIDPFGLQSGDYLIDSADLIKGKMETAGKIGWEVQYIEQGGIELEGARGGPLDAWRHARWGQRMSEELGADWAAFFGYMHEIDNILFDQDVTLEEVLMDLHNNREGRKIGGTGKTALELFLEGRLRTINPECEGKGGLY